MRLENAVAADVLERILSAYGFTMQKELSDKLGIAKSNVASWLQRGQVPGNVLVQCALDTGADVQWLVTGVFANANMHVNQESSKQPLLNGQSLIKKMLQSGGKPVLRRILEAYGFKTQKELSEYLGISTGTISTWVRREFFPGDVVIACALDTGSSLLWLATGNQLIIKNTTSNVDLKYFELPYFKIHSGNLIESGFLVVDPYFIKGEIININFVECVKGLFLVDFKENVIGNGKWLLDIDGIKDIYIVTRIPNNRIKICYDEVDFECSVHEIICLGKVIKTVIDN